MKHINAFELVVRLSQQHPEGWDVEVFAKAVGCSVELAKVILDGLTVCGAVVSFELHGRTLWHAADIRDVAKGGG